MITFYCRCSQRFDVPDDQAGESYQCPSCGLLVDAPTLDDAASIQDDGSYVLRESIPRARQVLPDVADVANIVSRDDTSDRRLSLQEFLKIGTTEDDLLQIKGEVRPGVPTHPKYDPVTGELVVPIDIKRDPAEAAPLVAQAVVLGYETRKPERRVTVWLPFPEMLRLPNLIVCTIVSFICYAALFATGALWPLIVLALPLLLMIVAHFANVVDETGPTRNDEIPRPMRGANLYEDVLRPLVQIFFAYFLANLPLLLINLYVSKLSPATDVGLTILFFALVPALLLTLITSGAVNNLLPHRALSVMSASSIDYWITAVFGYLATGLTLIAIGFAISSGDHFVGTISKGQAGGLSGTIFLAMPKWLETAIAPALMFAAMFLMHVFAWQLGILYRLHHDDFAWVLQKHDKTARNDTLAQLHRHRQQQMEEKARQARESLQRRQRATPGPTNNRGR